MELSPLFRLAGFLHLHTSNLVDAQPWHKARSMHEMEIEVLCRWKHLYQRTKTALLNLRMLMSGRTRSVFSGPTEPTVECDINGIQRRAFLDSDADANYISLDEVRRRGCIVNCTELLELKMGNGQWTNTQGTVKVPFAF